MAITKATASSIAPAAKGDIVIGSATNDAGVLGVGTNGHTLVADSAETLGVKWQAPVTGGYTELASGTLSGSAVNLTSISGSYRSLRLIIRNFLPATDGARCDIRVNADGNQRYYPNTNNDETNGTFAGNDRWFWKNQDNGTTQSLMVLDFPDYANTTTWKFVQGFGAFNNETTTTNVNFKQLNGGYNQTTAITQINIITSTGNFTSGDYVLYGVK